MPLEAKSQVLNYLKIIFARSKWKIRPTRRGLKFSANLGITQCTFRCKKAVWGKFFEVKVRLYERTYEQAYVSKCHDYIQFDNRRVNTASHLLLLMLSAFRIKK